MGYIYHYFATVVDSTSTVDGILTIDGKISSIEDYKFVKEVINKKFSLCGKESSVVIKSLSFLHEVSE